MASFPSVRSVSSKFTVSRGVHRSQRALTLLELMTVLVVIAILVVVIAPSFNYLRARSQKIKCLSNLRSLHVATSSYIQDNHHWPQISGASPGDLAYAKAWIDTLRPYSLEQINWICPAIQSALQAPDLNDPLNLRVDYFSTRFDMKESSPFQYARQPWFIETADVHGNGQEIIFPDGHIEEASDIAHAGK